MGRPIQMAQRAERHARILSILADAYEPMSLFDILDKLPPENKAARVVLHKDLIALAKADSILCVGRDNSRGRSMLYVGR